MNDAAQVSVMHRPRQSFDQLGRLQRRRTCLLEPPVQRAAGAKLQREVGEAADVTDLVELNDVRVLEAGDRFGLDLKAQPFRRWRARLRESS